MLSVNWQGELKGNESLTGCFMASMTTGQTVRTFHLRWVLRAKMILYHLFGLAFRMPSSVGCERSQRQAMPNAFRFKIWNLNLAAWDAFQQDTKKGP